MEKDYTIAWSERKTTSTGKTYLQVTLDGEGDKKISIWSDFPDFANLMTGFVVKGELKQNDKGYWNLYPPRTGTATKGAGFKSAMVEKAMERKEASIERFQGDKEEAIKLASAQRDAVLIVTTIFAKSVITEQDAKDEIIKWRNWFLSDEFTKSIIPF